jgi:hypothetical protein
MIYFFYWLAAAGFIEAGWRLWHALFWPYYLAKKIGATP